LQITFKQIRFTDPEFEQCFQIRLEVFVEEQNVPVEEERDRYDAVALHFLGSRNGVGVGTARVLLTDIETAKIGRVAISKSARGQGIGAELIRYIEKTVTATQFVLDAQTHALRFYERLGYQADGEEFMENGIPHRHMKKTRDAANTQGPA
jgi:predicted GNAT family N-acyltransferase